MSTYNTKTVSGYLSIFTALISLIASGWIMAQTPAEADVADDVEEVLITGSLIKGTPEDAANPVTAITEEDLRLSGNPSILQVMKNLPLSSGVDGSTNQFQSNGLEGATNVNLRGLGPGRTLALVNGQRRSYSGVTVTQAAYQPFVNLNLIPMAAVSRIEVLRDGASATYGSDAMAGVVNFITKAGFEGFEVSFGMNSIEGSDGDTNLNLIWGKKLDETSDILVTFSNYDRGELRVLDRADTNLLAFADNPQGGWSGLGQPGNLLLDAKGDNGEDHRVTVADPACDEVGGFYHAAIRGCRFNYAQFDNLVEEENGNQLYVEFNKELSSGDKLKLVLNTAAVEVPNWATSPSYPPTAAFSNPFAATHPGYIALVNDVNTGGYAALTQGYCSVADTVDASRFYWGTQSGETCELATTFINNSKMVDDEDMMPVETGVAFLDGSAVEATYNYGYFVDNGTVKSIYRDIATNTSAVLPVVSRLNNGRALGNGADGPNRGSRTYDSTFVSLAYDGSLTDNIDYQANFVYETIDTELQSADMFTDRYIQALSGFGGPNCIPANPTDPTDPTAGLTAGEDGCEYLNTISNSIDNAYDPNNVYGNTINPNYDASLANSKELLDWLIPDLYTELSNELTTLDFTVTGQDLFQLGGGGVNWAAGAQYRSESYSADYPGFNNFNSYPCNNEFITDASQCAGETGLTAFLSPGTPYDLSQTVFAVFGEVALPFSDDLTVQAALRFEDYSESDASLDYKIAGKYSISDVMSVRGSLSTSYKAPALSQNSLNDATSLSFIGSGINTFKAIDTSTIPGGLKPESSDNMNLGFVFNNDAHFFSADYWSIDITDVIITESHSAILASACPGRVCNADNPHFDRITFADGTNTTGDFSNKDLARIAVQVINGGKLTTSGIDLKYSIDFGGFTPQEAGIELSILSSYELDGVDHVGQLNANDASVRTLPGEKYKIYYNARLQDVHNIRVNYNSASGVTDERYSVDVDAFNTIDLSYNFAFLNDRGSFNVSVFNLTDEDAPLARLDLSYDPYTANVLGQTTKLGINFRF